MAGIELNATEQNVKRNWLRRAPLRSGFIPHLQAPDPGEQAPPAAPSVTELRLALHCAQLWNHEKSHNSNFDILCKLTEPSGLLGPVMIEEAVIK